MLSRRHGMTLLEVLIVVSLISVLLTISIAIAYNSIGRSNLRSGVTTVIQSIRRAQTLSQNNVDAKQWGIQILEGTSVVIFSGSNYSTRNVADDNVYFINDNITFSGVLYDKMTATPPNPDGAGLVFVQLTGATSPSDFSGSIVLTMANESQSVTVNGLGVVER
jgi:prepilin-type N-terminal cleavage/methylation domain-containing protein